MIIRRKESKFIDWVKIAPYKRILKNRGEYIELANDRGYMQILEITGKNLNGLSHEEQQSTLLNYHTWLVQFQTSFEIYTTKLPTDTTQQVAYLKFCLSNIERLLKKTTEQRIRAQLLDQKEILEQNIRTEILIQKKIYNSEFLLFLYGKTIKELDDIVQKSMSYGNQDFVPKSITKKKKEKVLEQINNMNGKV